MHRRTTLSCLTVFSSNMANILSNKQYTTCRQPNNQPEVHATQKHCNSHTRFDQSIVLISCVTSCSTHFIIAVYTVLVDICVSVCALILPKFDSDQISRQKGQKICNTPHVCSGTHRYVCRHGPVISKRNFSVSLFKSRKSHFSPVSQSVSTKSPELLWPNQHCHASS